MALKLGKIHMDVTLANDPAERVNHWGTADVRGLVASLLDQLSLNPDHVSEINITPGHLEIRVYLMNDQGEKYVWGAEGDPGRNLAGTDDSRRGKPAQEVRVYEARTY